METSPNVEVKRLKLDWKLLHPLVEVAPFSFFERITCSRILGGSVRCCVLLVFWNSAFSKINDLPCAFTSPLCT